MKPSNELTVFIAAREATCSDCGSIGLWKSLLYSSSLTTAL